MGGCPAAARGALDTGDLVQETVLHVLRRLDTFEPTARRRHAGVSPAVGHQPDPGRGPPNRSPSRACGVTAGPGVGHSRRRSKRPYGPRPTTAIVQCPDATEPTRPRDGGRADRGSVESWGDCAAVQHADGGRRAHGGDTCATPSDGSPEDVEPKTGSSNPESRIPKESAISRRRPRAGCSCANEARLTSAAY